MPRPFAISLVSQGTPGDLAIEWTHVAGASAEQQDQVRLVWGEFVGFARSGALAGDRIAPDKSTLDAQPIVIHATGGSQRFANVRLHRAALSCLLNVFEWIHHHVVALNAVRVSWDQIQGAREHQPIEFPPLSPALGFPFDVGELDRRFDIEILLELKQSEAGFDAINEALGAWFVGVGRGGYGNASIPPADSEMHFTDDVIESSGTRITWHIDALRADDAALDGLGNALAAVHRKLAGIKRVSIE